ncbi:uncharacterized protein A4U43_C01F25130 [Asparagus officinalis]|uniref:NAC domain-containing protein n=1 Tax=Asparagus officinalis TaxID=4686 RepID=A0A5P1FRZ8_ASPOF|nr:NAC domain-containing protein 76-like [Asparagus officinalis]ONK81086.1 uncharacterized protein A4U43_C01F25130 [Asparagus officinalis]
MNGQLTVPPGFRFHPTDEELLYYYLRKKVAYEAIDLDVIRDIDLNKLEPWDLKDKCRIGTGPQNEWYFFSHKDKKYPTGTRTNRATTAGFWKATGRDKAIHLSNSKRIGMRKTLVFYTGRAPHGQKTDWIMHEYRLDEGCTDVQEDGWVVCRVFKKKNHQRGIPPQSLLEEEDYHRLSHQQPTGSTSFDHKHANYQIPTPCDFSFHSSMHLPQLLSAESSVHQNFTSIPPSLSLNTLDLECSHNLMKLTSPSDWSILDKLLASHQNLDHIFHNNKCSPPTGQASMDIGSGGQKFPFQYLGCDAHDQMFKFSK